MFPKILTERHRPYFELFMLCVHLRTFCPSHCIHARLS